MSYYPADRGLISQHTLLDVPEGGRSQSIISRWSINTTSAVSALSSISVLVLWATVAYVTLKSLYIISSWAITRIRSYAQKQQQELNGVGKITSQYAYIYNTDYKRKYQDADDLESQLSSTSSVTSIPSLSYTPDVSSPASSTNSPPLSAINTSTPFVSTTLPPHSGESFQRLMKNSTLPLSYTADPDFHFPAPNSNMNSSHSPISFNSFESKLVSPSDHPMIKIH